MGCLRSSMGSTVAPNLRSTCAAAATACMTCSSTPGSCAAPTSAGRSPVTGRLNAATGSISGRRLWQHRPDRHRRLPRTRWPPSTLRAGGPIESSVWLNGKTPWLLTLAAVGLRPTTHSSMPGCVDLRRLGIRCASSAAKEGLDHGRVVLDGGRITLVPWRPVIAAAAFAIADGVHPVRAWREQRGLSQDAVALTSGLSKPFVSQIESGKRAGTITTLKKLAAALDVPVEALTVP